MNILNGDSAAGAFKQAFHIPTQEILVFRDVLSCGNLSKFSGMKGWSTFRRRYWADMFLTHGFGKTDDIEKAPRDFYNDFDELTDAAEINLWLGVSLSDHLLLVYVVMLFDYCGMDIGKLNLYQYDKTDDSRLTVIGLATLNPKQIEKHQPEALVLNLEQVKFCLDVWDALVSTTPEKLVQILKQRNSALPLLHNALQNLIYRFPDRDTGLSRFDRIILESTKKHAPNTARIIGEALAYDRRFNEAEDSFHALDTVGDIYLLSRLKNMAAKSLKQPLLSLNAMDVDLRQTTTEITEFGLDVLEGKYNVVQFNGINDWVAGIHLDSSHGKIWYRQGNGLILKAIV